MSFRKVFLVWLLCIPFIYIAVGWSTYGPSIDSHSEIERLLKEDKFRINTFDLTMMGTYVEAETPVQFVCRKSPILSWLPGVSEYYVAMVKPFKGYINYQIEDGSKLYQKVKKRHQRLKREYLENSRDQVSFTFGE